MEKKLFDCDEEVINNNINDNDNCYQNNCKYDENLEAIDYYKKIFEEMKINNKMVLDIQEKERQRIARDLHDSSLQNLTHLIHKLELSSKYLDTDIVQAKLEIALVNKNLKDIIQEIRNTIFNLRPMTFDDLGLKQSVERLINNYRLINKNEIVLSMDEVSSDNTLILITVYRIINECLSNAVYHSKSNQIEIKIIEKEAFLLIFIKDNGIGFDYDEMKNRKDVHFGLKIMEERVLLLNGILDIKSDSKGTDITIRIPKH